MNRTSATTMEWEEGEKVGRVRHTRMSAGVRSRRAWQAAETSWGQEEKTWAASEGRRQWVR